MTTPDDAAERRVATDIRRSIVAQAPAGSGKTTLLIERYLRLLAVAEAPEEILVVTFTRKAAAEIRSRVLGAIEAGELAAAVDVRARNVHEEWQIDSAPHRLRIQTIDAFALSIARRLPVTAGLPAQVAFVEDARELYSAAVDRLFERTDADGPFVTALASVLRLFDNDYTSCKSAICSMLGKREQWLDAVRIALPGPRARGGVQRLLAEGLAALQRHLIDDARQALGLELTAELEDIAREAAARLGRPVVDGHVTHDGALWRFIGGLLVTQRGSVRRQFDARLGFPATPAGRAAKVRMLASAEQVRELDAGDLIYNLRSMPDPSTDPADASQLEHIALVLSLAALELAAEFAHNGAVDFAELSFAARRALGPQEAPTDLLLALDHRLRHVLIDEFQDTSLSQMELLARLLEGWDGNDGRTLFAVGDPMQSIYRFRDAEVALMMRATREGVGNVRPEGVRLRTNFRSEAPVVEWINRVFAPAFGPVDDPQMGRVAFAPSAAANPTRPGAGVQLTLVDATADREGEAAAVAASIHGLRLRDPTASIVVLVRNRSHLSAIVRRLTASGIVWQGVDVDDAATYPVVRDLLVLIDALHRPHDRLVWLALLRAPFVGLALNDLLVFAGVANVGEHVLESRRAAVSADGAQRLDRVAPTLAAAFATRGQQPPALWLETTWRALAGPFAYANGDTEAQAAGVFELLERQATRQLDTNALRAALTARRRSTVGTTGAVQVMTIHRAKGLEFDHVLVAGLDRESRRSEPPLILWRPERGALLMAATTFRDERLYAWLWREERNREAHERIRLLYVAATRARTSLHLFACHAGGSEDPPSGSLLAAIWPTVRDEARYVPGARSAERPPPRPSLRLRTRHSQPSILVPAERLTERPRRDYSWPADITPFDRTVRNALRSIARHPLPADVAAYAAAARHNWRDALFAAGTRQRDLETTIALVERHVVNTLADPRGRWLLTERPTLTAGVHYECTDGDGRARIEVDFRFVESGTVWLVVLDTTESGESAPELTRWLERITRVLTEDRNETRIVRAAIYASAHARWTEAWPTA